MTTTKDRTAQHLKLASTARSPRRQRARTHDAPCPRSDAWPQNAHGIECQGCERCNWTGRVPARSSSGFVTARIGGRTTTFGVDAPVADVVTYEIEGELLSGDETPAFRAQLLEPRRETLALLESDGTGGPARVQWFGSEAACAAATAWLAAEARRRWPAEYGAPPDILREPQEAALLVVPALIGAPMTARYRTSAMGPHESADLRLMLELMLEANTDPRLRRAVRHLDVGETLKIGSMSVERLS